MQWGNGYRCFKCWAVLRGNYAMCNDCDAELCRLHRLDSRKPDYTIPCDQAHTTAVLHLGFLTLEETEEMRQLAGKEFLPKKVAKPATSKISRTNAARIVPIDRTAAIVVGETS